MQLYIAFPPDFPEEDVRGTRELFAEEVEASVREIEGYIAATDLDEKIEALRRAVGFEGTHSIIDLPSTDVLPNVRWANQWARVSTIAVEQEDCC